MKVVYGIVAAIVVLFVGLFLTAVFGFGLGLTELVILCGLAILVGIVVVLFKSSSKAHR